jgi:hypothetical protein
LPALFDSDLISLRRHRPIAASAHSSLL